MKDPTSQLRSATRRAKSDVANKLISMFLHELSRRASQAWSVRVDGQEYEKLVREWFNNKCPYCLCSLADTGSIVEHLDGMNRYRAGLHVPGNVLVACKRCNGEKRRDDSLKNLTLAESGWASFLSHDGTRCAATCSTCRYWTTVWAEEAERKARLSENLQRIHSFRGTFLELERILPPLRKALPELLAKLYYDCQIFAETEIKSLLERFEQISDGYIRQETAATRESDDPQNSAGPASTTSS
jgi:hypothetical protein